MTVYRVTWEFDGPQLATIGASASPGWSESWYLDTIGGLDGALRIAAESGPASFVGTRRPILASIYRIGRVRVTDVANFRLSKASYLNAMVGLSTSPAQVTCCVLVDFTVLPKGLGDTSHHRRSDIRGISTDLIDGNVLRPGAAFNALTRHLDYMGNHQGPDNPNAAFEGRWLMQYQDPAARKQPLLSLGITGPTSRFITVTNDFGPLAPGTQIRITGVKFPAFMNRIWKVRAVVGIGPQNSPYTLGNSRRQLAGVWDGVGNIQLAQELYSAPDQYSIVGLRTRATGRPTPLTRGRRSRG